MDGKGGITRRGLWKVSTNHLVWKAKADMVIPIIIHRYVPFKAASLVPMVGCLAVSIVFYNYHQYQKRSGVEIIPALVRLAPGVLTALVPKMISSLASTFGVKPAGVCASPRAAINRVEVSAVSGICIAEVVRNRENWKPGDGFLKQARREEIPEVSKRAELLMEAKPPFGDLSLIILGSRKAPGWLNRGYTNSGRSSEQDGPEQ